MRLELQRTGSILARGTNLSRIGKGVAGGIHAATGSDDCRDELAEAILKRAQELSNAAAESASEKAAGGTSAAQGISTAAMESLSAAESAAAQQEAAGQRSEAAAIYEAAVAGNRNPAEMIRQAPKVPYGYLAEDGIITYNGVTFVCDERTNSICLGDMSDEKQVITVALADGGQLKVNRNELDTLSKAVGMFSPEDLNRIMRAVALDTKLQSMQKELDDMKNSIGTQKEPGA